MSLKKVVQRVIHYYIESNQSQRWDELRLRRTQVLARMYPIFYIFSYYIDPLFDQGMHSSKFDFNNNGSVGDIEQFYSNYRKSRPMMSPHRSLLASITVLPT